MKIDQLYLVHEKTVFRFLLSLTGNPQLSEELTQETFYQAVKSIARFKGNSSVATWLCQIAKNLWLQYLEKEKKHGVFHELDLSAPDPRPLPDELIVQGEDRLRVFRAIHQLKESEKEIVLLRLNGDFSFKEIGEVFRKTENWARVTFYRAKQKLIERMKEDGY
ncbi:RNA polymerase sigma factor [Enterococcus sp. AD013-P3]|uniref:RNA polymerase sigma factor n=1 Tax=Enterococcus sp. AD013-P3 TaxID=3411036 RepID=UPI003B966A30